MRLIDVLLIVIRSWYLQPPCRLAAKKMDKRRWGQSACHEPQAVLMLLHYVIVSKPGCTGMARSPLAKQKENCEFNMGQRGKGWKMESCPCLKTAVYKPSHSFNWPSHTLRQVRLLKAWALTYSYCLTVELQLRYRSIHYHRYHAVSYTMKSNRTARLITGPVGSFHSPCSHELKETSTPYFAMQCLSCAHQLRQSKGWQSFSSKPLTSSVPRMPKELLLPWRSFGGRMWSRARPLNSWMSSNPLDPIQSCDLVPRTCRWQVNFKLKQE